MKIIRRLQHRLDLQAAVYGLKIPFLPTSFGTGLGAGREKALASAAHVPTLHPGCNKLANLHNKKCQNHYGGETDCAFRLGSAFKL